MKRYETPRTLIIYCPCSRHEVVIYRPVDIWPTFKAIMRQFGRPYKWGWRGGGVIDESLSTK